MLWLFGGEENYLKKARWVFKTWIKWAILYGVAITTDNFESVALRKKPNKHDFSFWTLWRSGMLMTRSVLGVEIFNRIMVLDKILKKEQSKNMTANNFWYCWGIGTHPIYRNQGFGTALMNYTFELAKRSSLPCYLETTSEEGVIIHAKHGYKLLSTAQLPNSQSKIYCMGKF